MAYPAHRFRGHAQPDSEPDQWVGVHSGPRICRTVPQHGRILPTRKELFGGFTVFMFNPTPHKVSEAEMSKRLDSLIHDPKMNAQEWVKDLKTFKYYFPKTVDEVHHMMSCAIEFLNLLAGTHDSIAARGYTDAIEAVNINRHGFKLKQSIDPAFLTKVLYLIETEQQNVYTELLDSYQANPIFPLVHLSHLVTQRAT